MELLGLLFEIRLAEPVTPTALAARTGYPLTTLSDYVQRLVDAGEVQRDPNPEDRRSHLLSVTPAGRERIVASSQAVARVVKAIVPRLERPLWEYEDAVAELRGALTDA
jgi:DNA-binding MarR family transcriptional regulator